MVFKFVRRPYAIKNKKLLEVIKKAEEADSYMFCITRKVKDELYHDTFTHKFLKGDIMLTLDEYAKLLEKEIK